MSRQDVVSTEQNETQMRESFNSQIEDVLCNKDRFEKKDGTIKCGLEVEYGIVSESDDPNLNEDLRNVVMSECRDFSDCELGATQIEMRTDPLDLREGTAKVLDQLIERENLIIQSVNNHKSELLRHGTNPFIL